MPRAAKHTHMPRERERASENVKERSALLTAIEIAISASVTVSMGEETSGAFSMIFFVSGEDRSTSSAVKSM